MVGPAECIVKCVGLVYERGNRIFSVFANNYELLVPFRCEGKKLEREKKQKDFLELQTSQLTAGCWLIG